MATFKVKGPDGVEHSVNAPEGTTQQDAIAYVAKTKYGVAQKVAPVQPASAEDPDTHLNTLKSFAKGSAKGVQHILDAPMDLINAAGPLANAAAKGFGGGYPEDFASEDIPQLPGYGEMPYIGGSVNALTAPVSGRGQDTTNDMAYTAGKWATPGAVISKALRAPMLIDVLSGAGAAVGEQTAGETGEVVGGMLAPVSALGKVLLMGRKPPPATPEAKAYDFIIDKADDAPKALENLKNAVAKGEKGTLAELTGDPSIYNIEEAVKKGTAGTRAIDVASQARTKQIAGEVEAVLPSGPVAPAQKAASDVVETRRDAINRAVEGEQSKLQQTAEAAQAESAQRALAAEDDILSAEGMETFAEQGARGAEDVATAARNELQTNIGDAATSTKLTDALTDAANNFRELVRKPAWEKFDALPAIPTKSYTTALDDVSEDFAQLTVDAAKKAHPDVMAYFKKGGMPDEIAPREIHALISELKGAVATKKAANAYGQPELLLERLASKLDKNLKTELGATYKDAAAAYAKEMDVYKPGKLGAALRKEDVNTAARGMGWKGEEGATLGKQLEDITSDLTARGETELATKVQAAFQDRVKNTVGSEGADKFLKEYDDLTAYLPAELNSKINAVSAAEQGQKIADKGLQTVRGKAATQKAAAERAKLRELTEQESIGRKLDTSTARTATRGAGLKTTMEKRITSKYADKPESTLSALLKNPDSTAELKRLYTAVKAKGGEAAFKSHVNKQLSSALFPAKGGAQQVTPKSIDEFIKRRDMLVNSGVLKNSEADDILKALDKTKTQTLRAQAAAQRLDQMTGEFDNLVASGGAALSMGAMPKANSLVIAGAIRRYLKKGISLRRNDPAVTSRVEAFLAAPETFMKQVTASSTPKQYADRLLRVILREPTADNTGE